MFAVSIVYCQVDVSATSRSLVQRMLSRNLRNEEALARVGWQHHKKINK